MILTKASFSYDSNPVSNCYNFLHQYDERVTTDGTYLIIDNKFKIRFTKGSYDRPSLYIVCNDGVTEFGPFSAAGGSWQSYNLHAVNGHLMISDNCFYFKFTNPSTGNQVGFVWIKQGDINLVAGIADSSYITDNLNFYNVGTASSVYLNIGRFCHFTMPIGQLFYTNKSIMVEQGSGNVLNLVGFLSCSNCTFDQIVTFNGQNYYAIGNNTLIYKDDLS